MKKLVSLMLAVLIAATLAAALTGCKDKNYPVEVANYTIKSEPKNIVVLDAPTADIIAYMDYERKFVGRSSDVDQQELEAAPVVGTASNPDVNKIVSLKADIVFCNDELSDTAKSNLEEHNIKVIKLQHPESLNEVKVTYETIGKILGGKDAGLRYADASFEQLTEELDRLWSGVAGNGGAAKPTICYLYYKNGGLHPMTTGHFGNVLMEHTDCVITANSSDYDKLDNKSFSGVNPNYIFYSDEPTLDAIKADPDLSKSLAVKNNKLVQIPYTHMCRPGQTAIDTLQTMIDAIYGKNGSATPDEVPATTAPAKKTNSTQPATQPASKPAANATQPATNPSQPATTAPATQPTTAPAAKDLSADYNIDLDGLSLEKYDDGDDVKAMQQRLEDLGYLKKSDNNVTGFYGNDSEAAVKAFQKKNALEDTGEADNKTLKTMFLSTAKKA